MNAFDLNTTRAIFSASGTWLAFVTPDNLVWRPDIKRVGHMVNDDIFSDSGAYLGTIEGNVLTWYQERSTVVCPRADVPVDVPGYPGLPAPNLIRASAPGASIDWAATASV